MNLGIAGRRAIVCASSRGLGRACAEALAQEGVAVTLNGRTPESLAEAADAIRGAIAAGILDELAIDETLATALLDE